MRDMHILTVIYKFTLIVAIVNTYIMLLVIRFFVPLRKQMMFNRIYRLIFTLTEGPMRLFGKKKLNKRLDFRAFAAGVIMVLLYSFFWDKVNAHKPYSEGLVYMLASFVTYSFFLTLFIFLADFIAAFNPLHAYGEFARVVHLMSDTIMGFWKKVFSFSDRNYAPLWGVLILIMINGIAMTLLSKLLGNAVAFGDNLRIGIKSALFFFSGLWVVFVVVRQIMSWSGVSEEFFMHKNTILFTEPLYIPFRKALPPYKIGFDLSPLIIGCLLSMMFLATFFFLWG